MPEAELPLRHSISYLSNLPAITPWAWGVGTDSDCHLFQDSKSMVLIADFQDGTSRPCLKDVVVVVIAEVLLKSTETVGLLDGSPGRPPRLSHSSWALWKMCVSFWCLTSTEARRPIRDGLVWKLYLWWSLCTLYLHACQVRVTVGDTGLCCCTCVTYFGR